MKNQYDDGPTSYEPDFLRGRFVTEANWPMYEANGVKNILGAIEKDDIHTPLSHAADIYGVANLMLGDAFDNETQRPLRHMAGVGIYATAAGLENAQRYAQRHNRPRVVKLPNGRIRIVREAPRNVHL